MGIYQTLSMAFFMLTEGPRISIALLGCAFSGFKNIKIKKRVLGNFCQRLLFFKYL